MEMPGFDAATYGDRFADVYDDWYGDEMDTDAGVERLAALAASACAAAGPGRVLELGVGTGRLAIPLAGRGLEVTGVDASAAMLAVLAGKPAGTSVTAVLGDMAELPVGDHRFDLVFVAWNTFFNLTSEPAQRACLERVAAVLAGPESRFVLEAFVPDLDRFGPSGTSVEPRSIATDRVVLSVSAQQPGSQEVIGSHVELSEAGGVRLRPWHIRYLSPAQLDGLAGRAGLALVDRWAGWANEPFDDDSPVHVSVYRRS